MLYILHGADDYSATQELEAIKKDGGDPSLLATSTSVFDGAQVTPDEFRVACETVPFLADKRLVIVDGLLHRFGLKQPGRGAPVRKTDARQTDPTPFATIATTTPPSTILVLMEGELKQPNPLFKAIAKAATVKSFPNLRTAELRDWIAAHAAGEGAAISEQAINFMARMIGGNLWIMSNELKKLALYCQGRRIEEKDVKAIVSYTQQASVFAMVDAIIEFNVQKAEASLQQMLNEGTSPIYLLSMLNRQMRLIVRARELKSQGLSEVQVKTRLGESSDFVVRKTIEQARGYTLPRLKQVYGQLLSTDLAIKTGRYEEAARHVSGELALNILLAELCQPVKQ